jgi:hypothetical protein
MPFDGLKSQQQLYDWAQINAGDTGLLIVAGEAVLHSLLINEIAAASTTVVLYDAATVAGANTGNEVASVDVSATGDRVYDIVFENGIVAKPALGDTQGDVMLTFRAL